MDVPEEEWGRGGGGDGTEEEGPNALLLSFPRDTFVPKIKLH